MNLQDLFQKIQRLIELNDHIFIYGFGSYGRNLYQILKKNNIFVDGFIVSKKSDEVDEYEIPVYEASEYIGENIGYILALNEKNKLEVMEYLKECSINKECIIDAGEYLEQFGKKRGVHVGSIEVTTVIGCKINCKYCPQSLFTTRYFEGKKERPSLMSMKTFKRCLDFFPDEYDLSFGGMAEPFLNEQCVEMMKLACNRGKKVSLYTTLVGINPNQVDEILNLPLNFVVIHVADKYGYAHIERNDLYYEILNKFINAKKKDGMPFVNICNAQSNPDSRVVEICSGKYEILTEMTDRAGNLDGGSLIHNKIKDGKIKCGNLGEELNNNILLPDGSVVLCCMDFGLQHVLGNIYENSFEEIMNGSEIQRVRKGMDGDIDYNILCRKCSYANKC
jgi:radical SAM protein with 4Fe4S-binding SPASM domain